MPTISANVSKKERDAIGEYANACGETMSNFFRKCILTEITFMRFYCDSNEYNFDISIPDNVSSNDENKIILETYNKIRKILGLKEQIEI